MPLPWTGVPPVTPLVCFLCSGEFVHPNAAKQTKADLQPPLGTPCRAVSLQILRAIVYTVDKLQGPGGLVRDFLAVGNQGLLVIPMPFLPLSFL